MKDIDKIESLLDHFSYSELSETQKEVVAKTISSEAEYESMRELQQKLEKFSKQTIAKLPEHVLSRVKATQKSQGKLRPRSVFLIDVPLYAAATLAIIIGVGGWWIGSRLDSNPIIVERKVPVFDTVFIASQPDTIIREKIVFVDYRKAKLEETAEPLIKEESPVRGITMKEKEALEQLLVRGSYQP